MCKQEFTRITLIVIFVFKQKTHNFPIFDFIFQARTEKQKTQILLRVLSSRL